jgi:hypothetical protein
MSRAKVDTFVMIVHFLNDKWEPLWQKNKGTNKQNAKHIYIEL